MIITFFVNEFHFLIFLLIYHSIFIILLVIIYSSRTIPFIFFYFHSKFFNTFHANIHAIQ